jgi:hypothetical protein
MKTLHYLILVGLMGLAVVGSMAGFIRVPAQSAPSPEPLLGFQPDGSDVWDEALADEPPLAPGAAIRIALDFMRFVRLPDYTREWRLDHLTLQRMSFSDGAEEWMYVADFHAEPGYNPAGEVPLTRFRVPVRFNGSVPESFIARIPQAQRFVFSPKSPLAP